jgi:DNA-binding NtrC family response regulator
MDSLEILVVDDEQSICLLLHDVLVRFGHRVETLQDARLAIDLAAERHFDLIFLDIRMPGVNGLDALKSLKELCPEATFVMITGYAQTDVVEECMSSGASACLGKPFSITQVVKLVEGVKAKAGAAAG